jgi:hypothetical protein
LFSKSASSFNKTDRGAPGAPEKTDVPPETGEKLPDSEIFHKHFLDFIHFFHAAQKPFSCSTLGSPAAPPPGPPGQLLGRGFRVART